MIDLTGGPADQQAELQAVIVSQSEQVFDDMMVLAESATSAALAANLSVDTSGLPRAPVFRDVDLRVADYTSVLAYLATLRSLLLAAPVYPADYAETDYSSALLTALVSLLYSDLVNGGCGIDTDDEENLWNRAREREIKSMQSQQGSATRQFAAAGFPMPTGAAQKAIQALQQEASEKIATANRDIAIKRADMYVENRKHAMTVSADLEKTLMANFLSKMDRLLEHYKVNVGKVTEDYRIRAQVYAAIAGAYVALWNANTGLAQAQAQLAIADTTGKVAIYRAEMDKVFEQAKLELDSKKTAASIYAAISAAAMSTINVNTSMGSQGNASISASSNTNYNYDENA